MNYFLSLSTQRLLLATAAMMSCLQKIVLFTPDDKPYVGKGERLWWVTVFVLHTMCESFLEAFNFRGLHSFGWDCRPRSSLCVTCIPSQGLKRSWLSCPRRANASNKNGHICKKSHPKWWTRNIELGRQKKRVTDWASWGEGGGGSGWDSGLVHLYTSDGSTGYCWKRSFRAPIVLILLFQQKCCCKGVLEPFDFKKVNLS